MQQSLWSWTKATLRRSELEVSFTAVGVFLLKLAHTRNNEDKNSNRITANRMMADVILESAY
jgi:hypothetical protein